MTTNSEFRNCCRRILFMLSVLIAGTAGCSSSNSSPETKVAEADALHTETVRGPVKVAIDLVPKEVRLSDEPTLTLTIDFEDGVTISAPPFGTALGEFAIRDFYEPVPETRDGRQVMQQIYTLEPTRAGTMSIDPISISFVDNRPDGDGKEHIIETEALLVEVKTMIDSEAPSLANLRPAAPPEDLPNTSSGRGIWLLAAVAVILIAGIIILLKARKKSNAAVPQLSPQELARRELDELIASGLSRTDVKAFFVELTGVVRRYIERSTGVKAPEQTTDEFLREVNGVKLFSEQVNRRLGLFLESADLVKFAGFQPDEETIRQSTHKAKQFIELKTHIATPDTFSAAEVSLNKTETST